MLKRLLEHSVTYSVYSAISQSLKSEPISLKNWLELFCWIILGVSIDIFLLTLMALGYGMIFSASIRDRLIDFGTSIWHYF